MIDANSAAGVEPTPCVVSHRLRRAAERAEPLALSDRRNLGMHLDAGCAACHDVLADLDESTLDWLAEPLAAVGGITDDAIDAAVAAGLARRADVENGAEHGADARLDDAWFDAAVDVRGPRGTIDDLGPSDVRPDSSRSRRLASRRWPWLVTAVAAGALLTVWTAAPEHAEFQARGEPPAPVGISIDFAQVVEGGHKPLYAGDAVSASAGVIARYTNPDGAYRHLTIAVRGADGAWRALGEVASIRSVGVDEDGPAIGPVMLASAPDPVELCGVFSVAPPDLASTWWRGHDTHTLCSRLTIAP